jgi:hypothetical protein
MSTWKIPAGARRPGKEGETMAIQLSSFLLGAGAVLVLPVTARILRPLLVEVVAAGMSVADEASRVIAEQVEVIEDIAAEARAKREAAAVAALAIEDEEMVEAVGEQDGEEMSRRARPRRREAGGGRRAS